ncbi:hypothetical protein IM687_18870 [Stutzerimonas stutzeri]|jgi:hypothetical protein|uniref:hypothetical protein n=1 Tax=Stutzerimonas stutzeri TaxID=316 RepID=UPI0018AA30BB|nr:hypothetical protein [Stutzerimonas stutzeri]QPI09201.1 hypothetical protein IM687_18870 [Stutzerimonas stutzeri]
MSKGSRAQRFFAGLLLGGLVLGLGWGVLLVGQLGRPSLESQWVEQAYAHKLRAAAAVSENRLLIVAGSGAMFGLDSKLLAEGLGRPVINLGVNAGIQSAFIRLYARQAIRPGDWVLLPLEYPLFHDRFSVTYPFLDYWLSHPSLKALDINSVQLVRIYWQTPLQRVWRGLRGSPRDALPLGLYGPHNLDANGDQLGTEAARQEPWMHEGVIASTIHRYGHDANSLNGTWAQWRQFAQEVAEKGGCAVFIPPALMDRPSYHLDEEGRYYTTLPQRAEAQGLNYQGEPFDFMYPARDFFDTNYHLNAEARRRHTESVLRLIRPAFEGCNAVQ